MKKYLNTFLVLFLLSSKPSFALFEKIKLGPLKVEIRKENLNNYCSSCEFPYKKFYEEYSRFPEEAWVLVWSDNLIEQKLSDLREKNLLKKEDKIIGIIPNENSIGNNANLYFLVCDKISADTLRKSLNGFERMSTWDFIIPEGNYELSLAQIGANRYTLALENLKKARYEWDD